MKNKLSCDLLFEDTDLAVMGMIVKIRFFAEYQTIGGIKLIQLPLPDRNYSSKVIPVNHAMDSRQKESLENDKT